MQLTELRRSILPFQIPDLRSSLWQVGNTLLPFAALWYLAYRSLAASYAIVLLFAAPAAGFLVRAFIIQHDCGHGSFFSSRQANQWLGRLMSLVSWTPFGFWRRYHALHHATSGHIGLGRHYDFWTLTVREYQALPGWKRRVYRVYRHPAVLFGVGPPLFFLVAQRLPWLAPRDWRRERWSIILTDLAIAGLLLGAHATIGLGAAVAVQLPIAWLASAAGMWLFYVQHQFEDTYWENDGAWDQLGASLQGASYYRLPRILAWFTGDIGLHHLHHLSTRIPNYRLRACLGSLPLLADAPVLTLRESLRCARLRLWDEEQRRLVGFEALAPSGAGAEHG